LANPNKKKKKKKKKKKTNFLQIKNKSHNLKFHNRKDNLWKRKNE
jgi:hypothetical protein